MKSKYLGFVSIGIELVASVMFAIYLGDYLTKKFLLSDMVTVALIFIFLGAWIFRLVVMLKKIQNSKNNE